MRPGSAVVQTSRAFGLEAFDPFPDGFRADPEGRGPGLRGLAFDPYPAVQLPTTKRGKAGILVDVHSVPSENH
jgi:hypothetical protein